MTLSQRDPKNENFSKTAPSEAKRCSSREKPRYLPEQSSPKNLKKRAKSNDARARQKIRANSNNRDLLSSKNLHAKNQAHSQKPQSVSKSTVKVSKSLPLPKSRSEEIIFNERRAAKLRVNIERKAKHRNAQAGRNKRIPAKVDGQTGKGVGIADRIKGLENAGKPKDFMDEVRDSIDPRPPLFTSQFLASDLADIEQIEEKRQMEAAIGKLSLPREINLLVIMQRAATYGGHKSA
jgi:hypothetical protein